MKVVSTLVEAHVFRQTKDDIEFLLIKRADDDELFPGIWQMVTGSIIENEKAFETAWREIQEETGLIPLKFWIAPNVNSFYNQAKDVINFIPVFAALVDSNSQVILSYEHSDYKWVNKEEATKMLIWKGQRNSVDTIHDYFIKEISSLNLIEIRIDGINYISQTKNKD